MYGVIFSANTDICENDPPVIASTKPKPSADSVSYTHLNAFLPVHQGYLKERKGYHY